MAGLIAAAPGPTNRHSGRSLASAAERLVGQPRDAGLFHVTEIAHWLMPLACHPERSEGSPRGVRFGGEVLRSAALRSE